MTPIVQLTHFLRGQVAVQAEIIDGRREWTCPNRPMMRPWEDCHFNESREEIEALLATVIPTKEGALAEIVSPY